MNMMLQHSQDNNIAAAIKHTTNDSTINDTAMRVLCLHDIGSSAPHLLNQLFNFAKKLNPATIRMMMLEMRLKRIRQMMAMRRIMMVIKMIHLNNSEHG